MTTYDPKQVAALNAAKAQAAANGQSTTAGNLASYSAFTQAPSSTVTQSNTKAPAPVTYPTNQIAQASPYMGNLSMGYQTTTPQTMQNYSIYSGNAAEKDYQKKQTDFNTLVTGMANKPKYDPNSIVDTLKGLGMDSSFQSRANIAKTLGLANYTGTAEQNTSLLKSIKDGGDATSNAFKQSEAILNGGTTTKGTAPSYKTNEIGTPGNPAPTYGSIPQTTVDQTDQSTSNYSSTNNQFYDENGDPIYQDPTDSEALASNDKTSTAFMDTIDKAYNDYTRTIQDIQSGALPLSNDENQLLVSTQAAIDRARTAQMTSNKAYEGIIKQQNLRSGGEYTPEISGGLLKAAIDQGTQKLFDIDSQGIEIVMKLRDSFKDKKYEQVNKEYTYLDNLLKQKQAIMLALNKAALQHEKDIRAFNLSLTKQALLQDKFTYDQYYKGQRLDQYGNALDISQQRADTTKSQGNQRISIQKKGQAITEKNVTSQINARDKKGRANPFE